MVNHWSKVSKNSPKQLGPVKQSSTGPTGPVNIFKKIKNSSFMGYLLSIVFYNILLYAEGEIYTPTRMEKTMHILLVGPVKV